jgi:hypothetical protein
MEIQTMDTNVTTAPAQDIGLFILNLRSEPQPGLLGAPVLELRLVVAPAEETARGLAVVMQPLQHPVVCSSFVTGPLIIMTVMHPTRTSMRFDLVGHQYDLPPTSGIANPVNFRATVVLDEDFSKGTVEYQYGVPLDGPVIQQPIIRIG